jgi:hypothetical protein
MREDIPSLPQYVFIVWNLVKHRDKFNFITECRLRLRKIRKASVRIADLRSERRIEPAISEI